MKTKEVIHLQPGTPVKSELKTALMTLRMTVQKDLT